MVVVGSASVSGSQVDLLEMKKNNTYVTVTDVPPGRKQRSEINEMWHPLGITSPTLKKKSKKNTTDFFLFLFF